MTESEEKLKSYVCDHLCKFSLQATNDIELQLHCDKCKLDKLVANVIMEN